MKKYCGARQAPDDNVVLAHYMVDNKGYKHSLRTGLCNPYCFSMAAMVAQMRLDVTFIHTLLVGNVFLHSGQTGPFFLGAVWPEHEGNHSHLSSSQVVNMLSYASSWHHA